MTYIVLFILNNEIHQGIISNLIDMTKEKIIPNYILKYNNDIIFSEQIFFNLKNTKKNKKNEFTYNIKYKIKITDKNLDIISKSYQILIIKKNFWLFKEYTSFDFDELDRSYYGNILHFILMILLLLV